MSIETQTFATLFVATIFTANPLFAQDTTEPPAANVTTTDETTAATETPAASPQEGVDDGEAVKENEAVEEKEAVEVDPETLFQEGRTLLFQGKYSEAVEKLTAAVAADETGKQANVRLHLARAYRYAQTPEKAEPLLAGILEHSPDHVEAGQLLAEIYHQQGNWQEIIDVLEPLLEFRHDYSTYHMLAEASYHLDDFKAARKFYREAIRLNGESGDDHLQLGNIYLAENRFALAAQSYEAASRLGLASSVLHFKLASAYFNLRNYFGNVSIAAVPEGKVGTISGNWYLIEPDPGKKDQFRVAPANSAIYHLAKAMQGPLGDRFDIRMLAANTYLNGRRYRDAYERFAELNEIVSEEGKLDQALYFFYFAESAFGDRKYDEYLHHLQKAVELDKESYEPAMVDAYLAVAEKHNQAGKLELYIKHLNLAVQQAPQNASLHLKLANGFLESKNYIQAVQQWRMVLDLEPEHPNRTQLLNQIKKYTRVNAT